MDQLAEWLKHPGAKLYQDWLISRMAGLVAQFGNAIEEQEPGYTTPITVGQADDRAEAMTLKHAMDVFESFGTRLHEKETAIELIERFEIS